MTRLSRRNLLLGGTAAAAGLIAAPHVRAARATPARRLIMVVAYGGWDVTYALDPKPGLGTIDVPAGDIQMFGDIPIWVDATRPAVTDFFTTHASKCAVVNGIGVQSIVHSDCSKRILTGTASDTNPDIGSIAAHDLGIDRPVPYLVLGQTSYTGPYASLAARAGTANQISSLMDPAAAFPPPGNLAPRWFPDGTESDLIRAHVEATAERERAIRGQMGSNARKIEDFLGSLERADELKAVGTFGDFDFTRDLGVQTDLAINAFSRDLCHVVQMEVTDWDTHDDNSRQALKHEDLYLGLDNLMTLLSTTPGSAAGTMLIDETVVVVVSEMSRTPKLNATGGKDHWPVTSALVMGAGVAGGRVIGASNDTLEGATIDLVSGNPTGDGVQLQYGNLAAGLLHLVGVDPSIHLPNSEPLHALMA